jgi:VWFA-related protein
MRYQIIFCLWLLALTSFDGWFRATLSAQETPKRSEFGSSLERLKWDPKKGAAVETREQKKKSASKPAEDAIRIETTLAVFDVLVVDKQGRYVNGLGKDNFVVAEDGKPQTVDVFTRGNDATRARSIVLIIDYSRSQFPYIQTSVEAAKLLVDKLSPKDRLAIVTDDVELLQDFTADKGVLKAKLESLKEKALAERQPGRSAQYSALFATLRELVIGEERPIIIFQTDGDELAALQPFVSGAPPFAQARVRQFSLVDICNAAQRAQATIYAVIPGLRLLGLSPEEQLMRARLIHEQNRLARSAFRPGMGEPMRAESEEGLSDAFYERLADSRQRQQAALATVAKISGGWPEYLQTPALAAPIYTRILNDINRRYIIGYYPTNTARDGKLRKVKIEVRGHPDFVVWGRKSYYAAGPEK